MKLFSYISKFTFIACLGLSFSVLAFEGKVVGVSDGDTVTVLDINKIQHKIRLAGIDAPEKWQDFGNNAKELLSNLVYGKTVHVPDIKLDRYGRTVSRILFGSKDASLEMIKAGMAWHCPFGANNFCTGSRGEVQRKTCTGSCRKSKALAVFEGTE